MSIGIAKPGNKLIFPRRGGIFTPGATQIGGGALGGTGGPAIRPYRNLSQRGNFHINTNNATNGSKLTCKVRAPYPLSTKGGGANVIVPVFCNWKQSAGATPFEAVGANSISPTKYSLEWNGFSVPITFGGNRSFTFPASLAIVEADPIIVSVANFGASAITSAAMPYVRALMTATAGQTYPAFTSMTEDVGYRYNKDQGGTNANLSDDIDSTGVMAVPASADTGQSAFLPVALVGYFVNGDAPSFWSHGDSIAQGTNDDPTVTTGYGWIRRGAIAAGIAHFGMSIGGMRVTDWTTQTRTASRAFISKYLKGGYCLNQVGFNDVGGGGTLAQVTSIWSDFRGLGTSKLYQSLIGCKTSSTNTTKWTDLANQNVTNSGFFSGGEADTQNAAYLADVGTTLDGTVDASTDERDQTTDHTKWALRTGAYTSSLAAAYTGGATTIILNAPPTVGEWLALSSGGTFDAQIRRANVVVNNGNGTWTVTLGSSNTVNAGFTSSHSSSDPIYGVPTNDGTHGNGLVHAAITSRNASFFSGLAAAGVC